MSVLIAIVGGGIKGAVAAATYAADHELVFLHVGWGQPAADRQRAALENLCQAYTGARLLAVDLSAAHDVGPGESVTRAVAEQTGRAEELAGWPMALAVGDAGISPKPGDTRGLLSTVLSIGVQYAVRLGASNVVTGVSQTIDESQRAAPPGEGSPDHRREFIHAFNIMAETALPSRSAVAVEAPLMDLTYPEVIRLAVRLQVPLELTWTCERGDPQPCGRCEPCQARSRAFAGAGATDPLSTARATGESDDCGLRIADLKSGRGL